MKNSILTQIIVLAAGLGKRMNNVDLPKVLVPLNGKPLIHYLLTSIKLANICERPVIVIGQKGDMVKNELGDQYDYVVQAEQLGTGHAVLCAREKLFGLSENILVLYGDQPLLKPETIRRICESHNENGSILTMATVSVSDFDDWRQTFYDFGRIIRDTSGRISRIVEKKDADSKTLAITEVNPSFFCFNADWLWKFLPMLNNNNNQNEFYLTDLVGLAVEQGIKINSVLVKPEEALGVNTVAQLEQITKI